MKVSIAISRAACDLYNHAARSTFQVTRLKRENRLNSLDELQPFVALIIAVKEENWQDKNSPRPEESRSINVEFPRRPV